MVAPEPGVGNTATETTDGGTTFGKLKQTLSSSLLTAQDKGGYRISLYVVMYNRRHVYFIHNLYKREMDQRKTNQLYSHDKLFDNFVSYMHKKRQKQQKKGLFDFFKTVSN